MAQQTINTFGLRGVSVYSKCCCHASDLCSKSLEFKPVLEDNELECGGNVVALGSRLKRMDFSLEHAGINLSALAIMTDSDVEGCCGCDCGGIGCQSCEDIVSVAYIKAGTPNPYFQILGKSLNLSGEPVQIQFPKCKLRSGPSGVFSQGKYMVSTLSGSAIPDEDGNLAIITNLATGAEYKLANNILYLSAGGCALDENGNKVVTSGTFNFCCGGTLHFGSDTLDASVKQDGRVCFEVNFPNLIDEDEANILEIGPNGQLFVDVDPADVPLADLISPEDGNTIVQDDNGLLYSPAGDVCVADAADNMLGLDAADCFYVKAPTVIDDATLACEGAYDPASNTINMPSVIVGRRLETGLLVPIPAITPTFVPITAIAVDTTGGLAAAANTPIIPCDGLYLVTVYLNFTGNSTTNTVVGAMVGLNAGTFFLRNYGSIPSAPPAGPGFQGAIRASRHACLTQGDELILNAYVEDASQPAFAGLNVNAAAIFAQRVGPC